MQLLQQAGGWALIDDAFTNPPVSTEQVLHVDKFLEYETPVPVELPSLGTALGEGWSEAGQDTLGEFLISSYLAMAGEEGAAAESTAATAAAGWGGDRLALWQHADGGLVLAWRLVWDTEADAAEFYAAVRDALSAQSDTDWSPADAGDGELLDLPGRVVRLSAGPDRHPPRVRPRPRNPHHSLASPNRRAIVPSPSISSSFRPPSRNPEVGPSLSLSKGCPRPTNHYPSPTTHCPMRLL